MKILYYILLVTLALLAISSGVAKVLLLPQEVEFFGRYGFSNPVLITFGLSQIVGGALMLIPKSRVSGAVLVAATFLISAIVLALSGNIPVTVLTISFIALLGFIIKANARLNERSNT